MNVPHRARPATYPPYSGAEDMTVARAAFFALLLGLAFSTHERRAHRLRLR
jgi:hypothetical protein